MTISEILVPMLNANEPEARLVELHVKDGQTVQKGSILFTIETTKAASEIESPKSGIVRLLVKEGDIITVGEKIAIIADTADEQMEIEPSEQTTGDKTDLRITKPALALAKALKIDLANLPTNQLVTEDFIRGFTRKTEIQKLNLPNLDKPYILIFGAGGHAKAIIEMVKQSGGYTIVGILDDDKSLTGKKVLGIPVLGRRDLLETLAFQGVKMAANGVGGIIDIGVRVKIFDLLEKAGFSFPALIHPRATVEPSANVGEGAQVFANAYVGSDAVLHEKCIANTNAVVSHDCVIGPYTHIAPGALLAGHVQVGGRTLIGMGVTTTIGVKIGSGVRIGNGAIVLADVPDKMVIQAGRYWVGIAETPK
jgi:sugar O-acyltransferase (sialic acid O-acetyltransferase NeuD family)